MAETKDRLSGLALKALVFASLANFVSAGAKCFVSTPSEPPPSGIEGFVRDVATEPFAGIEKFGGFAWLAAQILFLAWLYRAAAKSRMAGTGLPRQAPFWGILNFFIPVWNLIAPAFFLRDLAKGAGIRLPKRDAIAGYGLYAAAVLTEYVSAWLTVRYVILPMRSSPAFAENIAFGFLPADYSLTMDGLAIAQYTCIALLALHCFKYVRSVDAGFAESERRRREETAPEPGEGFGWPGLDADGNGVRMPQEGGN